MAFSWGLGNGTEAYFDATKVPSNLIGVRFQLNLDGLTELLNGDTSNFIAMHPTWTRA
jgi:hypothetical protein